MTDTMTTARRWRAVTLEHGTVAIADGVGRQAVLAAIARHGTIDEQLALAERIVRAVNAHDDLVAVLADILECEDECQPIEHSIVARARAALALRPTFAARPTRVRTSRTRLTRQDWLDRAREFRELAARGMKPRAYAAEAERCEKIAAAE